MRYVIAVSGGVDSVVLLDTLVYRRSVGNVNPWQQLPHGELIVAHFDHGIREDSSKDTVFVAGLAKKYGLAFYSKREELGEHASEDTARRHRYAFLHELCTLHDAQLITAHHVDDVAETIAININRGTGWRGLAVMDNSRILRPFLGVTKEEIRNYAAQYNLTWREDSTNENEKYLRNKLRRKLSDEDMAWQLASLRAAQVSLKHAIDIEATDLIGGAPYSRYFFSHCGDVVAIELLRALFLKECHISPVAASRQRALHAIKVARHGTVVHVSEGIQLRFGKRDFIVEMTS